MWIAATSESDMGLMVGLITRHVQRQAFKVQKVEEATLSAACPHMARPEQLARRAPHGGNLQASSPHKSENKQSHRETSYLFTEWDAAGADQSTECDVHPLTSYVSSGQHFW